MKNKTEKNLQKNHQLRNKRWKCTVKICYYNLRTKERIQWKWKHRWKTNELCKDLWAEQIRLNHMLWRCDCIESKISGDHCFSLNNFGALSLTFTNTNTHMHNHHQFMSLFIFIWILHTQQNQKKKSSEKPQRNFSEPMIFELIAGCLKIVLFFFSFLVTNSFYFYFKTIFFPLIRG